MTIYEKFKSMGAEIRLWQSDMFVKATPEAKHHHSPSLEGVYRKVEESNRLAARTNGEEVIASAEKSDGRE